MGKTKHTTNANSPVSEADRQALRVRLKTRIEEKCSQRAVEAAAGLPTGQLSKFLSGARVPKARDLRDVAAALDKLVPVEGAVPDGGETTLVALVEGTGFTTIIAVGDRVPVENRVVASLEEGLTAATAAAAAAAAKVQDLEQQLAAKDAEITAARNATHDAQAAAAKAKGEAADSQSALKQAKAQLNDTSRERDEARREAATARAQLTLPMLFTPLSAALRAQGITTWKGYAQHLENRVNDLEFSLAQAQGAPGVGTGAFFGGLLGVAVGALAASSDDKKPRRRAR